MTALRMVSWRWFAALLLTLMTAGGCTPTPTVSKIGIIGPFEGLYRDTGYAALAAVRRAIADCGPDDVELLPLALDDSAQPFAAARSARKLLVDPTVVGIVGPYSLETLAAVSPLLAGSDLAWSYPMAITADGEFADMEGGWGWLADLILAIADRAAALGASAVLVGGIPAVLQPDVAAAVSDAASDVSIRFADDVLELSGLGASDAVVWLGDPQSAAIMADQLSAQRPDLSFWMGPNGGDPVFTAHSSSGGARYWVSWVQAQYNSSVQPAPGEAASELTYAATCRVLANLYAASAVNQPPLRIQAFGIDEDGQSVPLGEP